MDFQQKMACINIIKDCKSIEGLRTIALEFAYACNDGKRWHDVLQHYHSELERQHEVNESRWRETEAVIDQTLNMLGIEHFQH